MRSVVGFDFPRILRERIQDAPGLFRERPPESFGAVVVALPLGGHFTRLCLYCIVHYAPGGRGHKVVIRRIPSIHEIRLLRYRFVGEPVVSLAVAA